MRKDHAEPFLAGDVVRFKNYHGTHKVFRVPRVYKEETAHSLDFVTVDSATGERKLYEDGKSVRIALGAYSGGISPDSEEVFVKFYIFPSGDILSDSGDVVNIKGDLAVAAQREFIKSLVNGEGRRYYLSLWTWDAARTKELKAQETALLALISE
jgi:hypothetical protein